MKSESEEGESEADQDAGNLKEEIEALDEEAELIKNLLATKKKKEMLEKKRVMQKNRKEKNKSDFRRSGGRRQVR